MYNRTAATIEGPLRAVATALAAVLTLTACQGPYLLRLGAEQLRFSARARPISERLSETSDQGLRRSLELVLEVRRFASDSGLDAGGSYLTVADTDGLAVAWVVSAAYRDRLEPYLWRYPLVGAIPYRGYFDRDRAEAFAAGLAREGLDVRVTEAAGYSTLGWFDDPLPSGLLALDEVSLATVVLHELVHSSLFVPGQMDFNESLATVVSERLAVEFFAGRSSRDTAEARRRMELSTARSRFYDGLARRLRGLFERAAAGGPDAGRVLSERRALYAAAAADFEAGGLAGSRGRFLGGRPDNASFLAVYRYHRRLAELHAWADAFDGHEGWAGCALNALSDRLEAADGPYDVLALAPPLCFENGT